MTSWFDFLDTLDLKDDVTNYGEIFRQGILAALQECLKEKNTPDERKMLMQKPLISVTMWLLFKTDIAITEKYEEDPEKIDTQSEDQ